MSSLIHTLEFIKYHTFFGRTIKHYSPSGKYVDYGEENIVTPEGNSFLIKSIRFNYFDPDGKGKDSYINVKYGNGTMQPSQSGNTQNPTQDKVYIFHSEKFLELPMENQDYAKNYFTNHVSIGGFWDYIYSVVIQVDGNGSSIADFEDFMNMSQNSWQLHFNDAVSAASDTNSQYRNFKYILKYHPDILKERLKYQDRVNLLEVLAYHELWDFLDEVDEQEFALLLLETTPSNEEYALYQKMFEFNQQQNTFLFKVLEDKFDNPSNLKFVMILTRFLYNYKKNLGTNVLKDFINSIPENRIIPIRRLRLKPSLDLYGPHPIFNFNTNSINFIRVDFFIGSGNLIRSYNSTNQDPFGYLYGNYLYDEMVKVFIWRTNEQVGLDQGRIIPLPAFAVKAFHNAISDDITLKDVISKIVETVGIILPYMKLLQIVEMGALWYEADLLATSFATANAFGGLYISAYLEIELKKNSQGIKFLKAYNYLSFIYGGKDLRKKEFWKVLVDKIWRREPMALSDAENLMTLWSTFIATPEFNPQPFTDKNFIKQMDNIKNALEYAEQ